MVIALFLLVGCTLQQPHINVVCNKPYIQIGTECCLDNNNNSVCDKDESISQDNKTDTQGQPSILTEEPEEPEIVKEQETDKERQETNTPPNELPERGFSIEELSAFINKMSGSSKFLEYDLNTSYANKLKENNHLVFTNNNQYKTWVIEVINNKEGSLETINDFYNYVKAENWEGWKFYVNETSWHWLHTPLTENELKEAVPDYDYKTRYRTDLYSSWIDHDVTEKVINYLNKTILQYRMETMIFTPEQEDGFWIGNWENFKLIYKIPCTKDIIVYYRPKYDTTAEAYFISQKKDGVMDFWERDIEKILPTTLNYSKQIMDFCGINQEMFENAAFNGYDEHNKLVHNWKVYYALVFNYTFNANVTLKPSDPDNETFKIDHINITFISYEEESVLKTLRVKIELETEMKTYDYGEATIYVGNVNPGYVIKKNGISFEHEKFGKNTTIIFKPYYGTKETPDYYKYHIGQPIRKKLT